MHIRNYTCVLNSAFFAFLEQGNPYALEIPV